MINRQTNQASSASKSCFKFCYAGSTDLLQAKGGSLANHVAPPYKGDQIAHEGTKGNNLEEQLSLLSRDQNR